LRYSLDREGSLRLIYLIIRISNGRW